VVLYSSAPDGYWLLAIGYRLLAIGYALRRRRRRLQLVEAIPELLAALVEVVE
jgi:hypothetical protein